MPAIKVNGAMREVNSPSDTPLLYVLNDCVWQAGLAHFGILFWPTPGQFEI
jgi:hypothetical protein